MNEQNSIVLLIWMIIFSFICTPQVQGNMELLMSDYNSYVIVPSKKKTELQKFAFWFHQDYKLLFKNFYDGAKIYFNSISSNPERLKILRTELKSFLIKNKDIEPNELRKEWIKLGAQSWQNDLDIFETLNDFVELLDKNDWGQAEKVRIVP